MNSTLEENERRNDTTCNIGIDLGTTNTVVSYMNQDGSIEHLKIGSKNAIPSVIFFDGISDGTNNIYFGENALKRCRKNSQSVVRLFKRKIGNPKEKFTIIIDSSKDTSVLPKYYVIDTNCFCDEPDILDFFNSNDTVFLPVTVTNELGYRAKQQETKYSAEKALENLAASNEKYTCKIVYEESDLNLLPKDFFKAESRNDENDHKVLSVAIKHKEQNVILITSDNKLRGIKAPQCGINATKLSDFKLDKLPEKRNANNHFSITAEEATAYFLRYIRDEACRVLNCGGLNAVITVPVNFNNIQVEATKRAAKKAGFKEVCIEKEPVAAAIAYSLDQNSDRNILVYDFGGGTFDVAIVNFSKEKYEFDVLATDGNPELGGQDITDEFANYIKDILADEEDLQLYSLEESNLGVPEYYNDLMIVENEAERVKQSLSSVDEDTIALLNLYTPNGKGLNKQIHITKRELEEIVADIVRKPTYCIEQAIKEAGLVAEGIDVVILSGGTSLMPLVKEKVHNFFGKLPFSDKNPATLIADGAAIIAQNHFEEKNIQPSDAQASDLGTDRTANKAKRGPIRKTKAISDLGIATGNGSFEWDFDPVILYGTELPASGHKNYYLISDNQKDVDIKVYSRKKNSAVTKCHQCEFLDEIHITNIPAFKKKEVLVSLVYTLTEEYELQVSAEIKDNNGNTLVESKSMTISRDSVK